MQHQEAITLFVGKSSTFDHTISQFPTFILMLIWKLTGYISQLTHTVKCPHTNVRKN